MEMEEMTEELMACKTEPEMLNIALAIATEIYEVGYRAGRGDYAQA